MVRPAPLHNILAYLLSRMTFTIKFKTVTDHGDGTYTLNKLCDFHHAQVGFYITIDSKRYRIVEQNPLAGTMIVRGPDPITVKEFDLYNPFFFHGTPLAGQVALSKITDMNKKTPLLFLMEPFVTEEDYSTMSSIDRRVDFTLCALSQAQTDKWSTDQIYDMTITPMANLIQDYTRMLMDSNFFYNAKMKSRPKFYTKFGIAIQGMGTKKLYFSEKFAGVGVDMHLEIYRLDPCNDCLQNKFIQADSGFFLMTS